MVIPMIQSSSRSEIRSEAHSKTRSIAPLLLAGAHLVVVTLLCAPALVPAPAAAQAAPDATLFVTADRCMGCHNGLVTPAGLDVSMGADWRPSMMANSARDPYWQAAVRRETLAHPQVAAAIQDECSACHMPMMRYQAKAAGGQGRVFDNLPAPLLGVAAATPAALLAADGVSCTLCHQVRADGLGEESSFVAGFVIDTTHPLSAGMATGTAPDTPGRPPRELFGPFSVDAARAEIMRSSSGFSPTRADHIQSSELCATCHTLYTHARGPGGEVVGELPEQVPYLEWRHSAYPETKSCQACHMPVVEGEMAITGVLGVPRTHVSRHVFRGGNFLLPRIFNAERAALAVTALPQELDTASRRTVEHLESAAARVLIEHTAVSAGRLTADVAVASLAGHKLPTAYPSRRAWLHLVVRDVGGAVVFESGALDEQGRIAGNDNDLDPARYEPHYEAIDSAEQVQVYEAIMADADGAVTTGLIAAVRFVKDNRLLPDGFDKGTAEDDVAVRGEAFGDEDFVAGGDRVRYGVDLGGARGPFNVQAELWYQPIGYRWAHNLAEEQAPEIDRFVTLYDRMAGGSATVLARAATEVAAE
jgi:hypothetical protein